MVHIAPAETGGQRIELRGLPDSLANAERLGADGALVGDDRVAVRFTFDQTHRPAGQRTETTKLCLYAVASGAILREEVSYFAPPAQPR